ncbi:hypothetical protein [Scandinavium goeteborgense]|uniref:Uncharacterized protein n=1 Tax=Scandinavium goeteborgense TaxID=1851514 RepID=A0A4R6EBX1_SCAGO|nr:hypothetical protein [Scandinavium goeteborgense]TDN55625.1 hypothetical protein EC847_11340 [Scandinavium goeteborgense]
MKYLVDSEVKEEVSEIFKLGIIKPSDKIILCSPRYTADSEINAFKTYHYNFSRFRIITKIKQFVLLIYLVLLYRPDVIFSGYPLLKHRLINVISFGSVKHFSYLRGLFADASNYKGFSDLLYLKIKRIPSLLKINNFQCDKIITISNLNVNFLLARSVSKELIDLIEPPWLENIKEKRKSNRGNIGFYNDRTIYFVSQAFAVHSSMDAAKSQLEFAIELKHKLKDKGIELIIRKHPRDYTVYEDYGFSINKAPSYDFIEMLHENDILISPFSTMAFEASYLGVNSIFYSTPELDKSYARVYKNIGITPLYDVIDIVNVLLNDDFKQTANKINGNVFYKSTPAGKNVC